jgi:hypothetical protein
MLTFLVTSQTMLMETMIYLEALTDRAMSLDAMSHAAYNSPKFWEHLDFVKVTFIGQISVGLYHHTNT